MAISKPVKQLPKTIKGSSVIDLRNNAEDNYSVSIGMVDVVSSYGFERIEKITASVKVGETFLFPSPNAIEDSLDPKWEESDIFKLIAAIPVAGEEASNFASGTADMVQTLSAGNTALNSFKRMQFDGVTPRIFNFSFLLYPQNKDDSDKMRDAILKIKRYASPSLDGKKEDSAVKEYVQTAAQWASSNLGGVGQDYANNMVITPPKKWMITFHNNFIQNNIKPQLCVCTKVSIDYNQLGFASYFADGTPKGIKVDLAFQEILPVFEGVFS